MRLPPTAWVRPWIGLIVLATFLAPAIPSAALAGKQDKNNGSKQEQRAPSSSGSGRSSASPAKRQGSGGYQRQHQGNSSPGTTSGRNRWQGQSGSRTSAGSGSRQQQGGERQERRTSSRQGEGERRQSYPLNTPYRRPSDKNAGRGSSKQARSTSNDRRHKRTVVNRNVVNVKRRVDRTVIVKGRWGYRRSWVAARPWGWGWYGGWGPGPVVYPAWGWWAVSAPAWGVVSLSPTIVIQQSMDEAVASSADSFAVPNSDFEIFHASIRPIAERVIEFNFAYEEESYLAKADCEQGLLNDEEPSALEEAELMHAACSLAFGSFDPSATRS